MAGKASDRKDRSRALLSDDALPKIEIPRSAAHRRRQFKLPEHLKTPIPMGRRAPAASKDGADAENQAPKRRRRQSTGRFKERTLGWFQTGEELETREGIEPSELDPDPKSRTPLLIFVVGTTVVVAAALVWWFT